MRLSVIDEMEPPPWEKERLEREPNGRPWITVSYAQSVDGCIAARPDQQLHLSGEQAQTETHRLRAGHDAILVGIGTVLADDPRLTVRLVSGSHPRPVVLDSLLRFPASARMLSGPAERPLLFTSESASHDREAALTDVGAEVVRLPAGEDGLVRLRDVAGELHARGIRSVMVEGGAGIITRFLQRRLVDDLVVTITPRIVRGGLRAVGDLVESEFRPPLPIRTVRARRAGEDVILYAKPVWSSP